MNKELWTNNDEIRRTCCFDYEDLGRSHLLLCWGEGRGETAFCEPFLWWKHFFVRNEAAQDRLNAHAAGVIGDHEWRVMMNEEWWWMKSDDERREKSDREEVRGKRMTDRKWEGKEWQTGSGDVISIKMSTGRMKKNPRNFGTSKCSKNGFFLLHFILHEKTSKFANFIWPVQISSRPHLNISENIEDTK